MTIPQPQDQIKTVIRYNKSDRQWEAVNATVTIHKTRREALLAALAHDRPELHHHVVELARIHGNGKTITNGLLKAASLICKGKVYHGGEVASQSRADVYHRVKFAGLPRQFSCTCEARVYDAQLGKICAHVLAQHLAYVTGTELSDPPIPFEGEPVIVEGRKSWNPTDWDDIWDGGTKPDEDVEIDIDAFMTS